MVNWTGYELIVGSRIDPQFGPVLLFGMGGQLVEVFKDRALGLPPLNTTLARRMMEQTKIYTALKGVRGRAADRPRRRSSSSWSASASSSSSSRWIRGDRHQPAARLARAAHRARRARRPPRPAATPEPDLPRLAIRPYPRQYAATWTCRGRRRRSRIRPIRPEDEPLMVEFHAHAVRARPSSSATCAHLGLDERTAHERLIRICFVDYDREMALVAERDDPATGRPEIVGDRPPQPRLRDRRRRVRGPRHGRVAGHAASARSCSAGSSTIARAEGVAVRSAPRCAPRTSAMRRAAEKVGFTITPRLPPTRWSAPRCGWPEAGIPVAGGRALPCPTLSRRAASDAPGAGGVSVGPGFRRPDRDGDRARRRVTAVVVTPRRRTRARPGSGSVMSTGSLATPPLGRPGRPAVAGGGHGGVGRARPGSCRPSRRSRRRAAAGRSRCPRGASAPASSSSRRSRRGARRRRECGREADGCRGPPNVPPPIAIAPGRRC